MTSWIKCSERMPEKNGRYLVVEQYSSSSKWIGVGALRDGKWDFSDTIYWMPLPKAPE